LLAAAAKGRKWLGHERDFHPRLADQQQIRLGDAIFPTLGSDVPSSSRKSSLAVLPFAEG
jgi:hypothetical protein